MTTPKPPITPSAPMTQMLTRPPMGVTPPLQVQMPPGMPRLPSAANQHPHQPIDPSLDDKPLQPATPYQGPVAHNGYLVDGRTLAAEQPDPEAMKAQQKAEADAAKAAEKAQVTATRDQAKASQERKRMLTAGIRGIRPPKVASTGNPPLGRYYEPGNPGGTTTPNLTHLPSSPDFGSGTPLYRNFVQPFALRNAIGRRQYGGPFWGMPHGAWGAQYAQNVGDGTAGRTLGDMFSRMAGQAGEALRTGDGRNMRFPTDFA
jgi:hypothetical protein